MSKNETINKNETTQGTSKDLFSTYHENVDKLFTGIKQSVPQYHQSITNVQQEYLQAYENVVDSTIALQKEYVKKAGIAANIPEATLKVIHDTTEEFVKAASIQNQITLATIDATQQNIKTFNDNAKSFADLNRNILQSWISAFTTKN
jgi:spore coat polysaccharide biosynthesis protein SpsF (cytidylyltransferase family)